MRNKKEGIVVALFAVFFLSSIAFAVDCPIPDTGQTKCYDNSQEITCPEPGEAFYGQDGNYNSNTQSYTKLDENGADLPDEATEWVMVRDNVTGLIWEVKQDKDDIQNYTNPHDADNTYTWYDSNPETNGGDAGTPGDGTDTEDFINALNTTQFGGFSNWRLPTIKELSFIRNMDTYNPAINTGYFPNAASSTYWSSTTEASITVNAWYIGFYSGPVSNYNKSHSYYVRAVRGGQCGSFDNYIDNGDETVTDTNTGLMWQKDGTTSPTTWEDALLYCEELTLAGYDDWRLPNINELQSLVDYDESHPSINTIFFPNTEMPDYWSSTTRADKTTYAWPVYFYYGYVSYSNKLHSYYVRAVRGGQCESFGDSDGDTVCDDGDNSGTPGDNPCTGGEKLNCDDNCPTNDYNPFQIDCDEDGEGDVCDGNTIDNDGDGIDDGEGAGHGCDNCPYVSNPNQEDIDEDNLGDVCDNCPNHYNPSQEDTYPPQGNSIGDACDCEADFLCDGSVDSGDVMLFLLDFGRGEYNNHCTNEEPCNGDFNCDANVDAADVTKFLEDFGRSEFFNPCPACVEDDWCEYP